MRRKYVAFLLFLVCFFCKKKKCNKLKFGRFCLVIIMHCYVSKRSEVENRNMIPRRSYHTRHSNWKKGITKCIPPLPSLDDGLRPYAAVARRRRHTEILLTQPDSPCFPRKVFFFPAPSVSGDSAAAGDAVYPTASAAARERVVMMMMPPMQSRG